MSGIFGVISKDECINDLYYGVDYNSHLGTRRAGLSTFDGNIFVRGIHNIESSYFRTKFENELDKFKGKSGIGVISDTESQPIIINSHLGIYSIVTVSKINNIDEISNRLLKKGIHFSEVSSIGINATELVALLINECDSFESGIENVFNSIKGSCTLMLLTEKGILVARDKLGRTPVILAKKEGSLAISSETTSFDNLGYKIDKYIGPGEVLFLTADGYQQIRKPNNKMQICSFLWVYYGFPSSNYENINVEECRYKCGANLAKNDNVDVDFVCGVPDSGTASAIGYSNEKKIPFKHAYVKYTPTWPRSFMPQNQKTRDLVAKMKLLSISSIINDKKIVVCDDSIVRGTQLKNKTLELFKNGAKEVHLRPSCPTLIYPCEFLNFSVSKSTMDLIGRRIIKQIDGREDAYLDEYSTPGTDRYNKMVNMIGEELGATSLKYQHIDDLVNAIGLPKEKLCTHCWDGTSYF